jgi:ATP-dependent helicase HepA
MRYKSPTVWRPGQKLVHPFNPELGVGEVVEVDGRFLVVRFPDAEREIRLAAEGSGLAPLELGPGTRARLVDSDQEVQIAERLESGYRLSDGRTVDDADLWPLGRVDSPLERLASLRLDPVASLRNRLDGVRLAELRGGGGFASLLGGRIQLFAHQLHTADRALQDDPVRWLLADEVGLGKTIEACLILSALLRTGRAERALVVAPRTLAVQWLGELYRKFHQTFALLDQERIDAVAEIYEADANPFEVHPSGVISLELLTSDRRISRLAEAAAPDLIVIDEAHRLVQRDLDETIAPLVAGAKHALLLTAAPLAADREGFHRLLSLLHPEAYPTFAAFAEAVDAGNATLRCTSAVRRKDLGGFQPRVPRPIDLPAPARTLADDARAAWLIEQVPRWRERNEKALVFVHDPDEVEALKTFLERRARTHIAVFHEGVSAARRDLEVARFRDTRAPVLISSEAGGEGRNFQFCHRMVHFDLPSDPIRLEQRIGRLDRIGREIPVEIVYFRHEAVQPDVARLFERLDLFARPSAGLDAALGGVGDAIRRATRARSRLDREAIAAEVERERGHHRRDLPRSFYPDAYDAARADEILARVPPDLEERTRRFCLEAAEDLGFEVVDKGGAATYYVEFGGHARVESLPGVEGGSRFLGTFDRAESVRREEIDFFASGHPLVEGLLLELEDGPRGRACVIDIPGKGREGAGLIVVGSGDAGWRTTVIDASGAPRPEWTATVLEGLTDARDANPADWGLAATWADQIRELSERLELGDGAVGATAFFRFC